MEMQADYQYIDVSISECVLCPKVHLNTGQIAWTATHANRHTHTR